MPSISTESFSRKWIAERLGLGAHLGEGGVPVAAVELMVAGDVHHRLAGERLGGPAEPLHAHVDVAGQHHHVGRGCGLRIRGEGGELHVEVGQDQEFHSSSSVNASNFNFPRRSCSRCFGHSTSSHERFVAISPGSPQT